MEYSLKDIRHSIEIVLQEIYPDLKMLDIGHYSFQNILDQIIFELIKEDYREHAKRSTIQEYINRYDLDALNRKYTRAIQYGQYYRDFDNAMLEKEIGMRISEMERQDVSGSRKFSGHMYTEQEFFGYRLQAECKLLNKLHGGQIESSKKVSEQRFEDLFTKYEKCRDDLEPMVNDSNQVIARTLTYYGVEEHFFIEFMYQIILEAEKRRYPEIPRERILDVISMKPILSRKEWCREYYFAMNTMLMKREEYCADFFDDDDDQWLRKKEVLLDTFRLKNCIIQGPYLDKFVEIIGKCKVDEKANFIIEHYWVWDKRHEFTWNEKRIRYFRKLHKALYREIPKPSIK